MAPPAPTATLTRWRTWSVSTGPSCGRWPGTARRPRPVKVVARAHQSLIWQRTRTFQRLRSTPRHLVQGHAELLQNQATGDDGCRAADAAERHGGQTSARATGV